MSVLEYFGLILIVLSIAGLPGYLIGYHLGYDDAKTGKPKDWTKTRKPPSAVD